MNTNRFIGVVRDGRFQVLASDASAASSYRLTEALPQAGLSPGSGEIGLSRHEGMAVLVRGVVGEEWIYAASVVEMADEILTAVVARVFAVEPGERAHHLPGAL